MAALSYTILHSQNLYFVPLQRREQTLFMFSPFHWFLFLSQVLINLLKVMVYFRFVLLKDDWQVKHHKEAIKLFPKSGLLLSFVGWQSLWLLQWIFQCSRKRCSISGMHRNVTSVGKFWRVYLFIYLLLHPGFCRGSKRDLFARTSSAM